MNSIRCPHCGFIDFETAEKCKKCGHLFVSLNGLSTVELKKPGRLSRLLGEVPEEITENAYREIQNLLAITYIPHISPAVVHAILNKYGLSLEEAKPHFRDFFSRILRHLTSDNKITDEDVLQIQHLKVLFGLSDQESQRLQQEIVLPIYEGEVKKALAQASIPPQTKERLLDLSALLRIDLQLAKSIYAKYARPIYQKQFHTLIADRRLSPDKEAKLSALADSLGVRLELDDATKATLSRYRYFWRVSQGELPVIDSAIHLREGELCAASIPASHYEIRWRTKGIHHGGFAASVKITGGLRYRAGYLNREYVKEDVMTLLDYGTLYLTNQRLLFKGSNKSTYIPLDKVIDYTFYDDGLVVEKDTGKNQIYKLEGDIQLLTAIMEGLFSGQAFKNYRKEERQSEYRKEDAKRESSRQRARREEYKYENKREEKTNSSASPSKSSYEILGVREGATLEEITVAYKRMINDYHPDKYGTRPREFIELATEKTKEINHAYSELKEKLRK